MPSDEVASEVITSDAASNGTMMTSNESTISADVIFDATVCIAMATDAAVDGGMVTSKEADNDAMTSTEIGCKVAMCVNPYWLGWMALWAFLCLRLLHCCPLWKRQERTW